MLRQVKTSVSIPIAMKLSPFFSSTANMAKRLVEEGANGLVFFNRFYQPDLNLETLEVAPRLVLSNSNELRLPLRWVAILFGRLLADLAITSGVHTSEDVLKGLMAGAKVTMMASELLQNGIKRITQVLGEIRTWMNEHEYESVAQMIGSMSQQHCAEPAAFERANKPDSTLRKSFNSSVRLATMNRQMLVLKQLIFNRSRLPNLPITSLTNITFSLVRNWNA
jgi:dihydroorotate dehydrogenase (fumarate)